MADIDDEVKEALSEVRKVGANYEETQQEVGLDIPVDLIHFKKFPVVDPPGKYMKVGHDTRWDIRSGRQSRVAGLQRSVHRRPQILGLLQQSRSSTCWR